MRTSIKILLGFLLLLSFVNTAAAKNDDIIILKNGSEYHGRLYRITDTDTIFITDGKTITVKNEDLYMIALSGERKYDKVKNIKEIEDKDIQNAFTFLNSYKNTPDEDIVIYLDKTDIRYENGKIIKNVKMIYKILNDAGKDYASSSFIYHSESENAKLLYAVTINSSGDIFSIKENAINKERAENRYPLYDRFKRLKFSMQNPEPGNIFAYEYEITSTASRPIFDLFYLRSENNIINKSLSISGFGRKLKYRLSKGETDFNKPKITNKKDFFKIEAENLKKLVIDENIIPSVEYITPFVAVYETPDMRNFASEIYKDIHENSVKLENYAAKLNISSADKTEIFHKLYSHILNSTRHAPFSPAYTNFKFSGIADIISDNRLNSFDKAKLFILLLKHFNINGELFLVSSDEFPESLKKLHIPAVYNEAGVYVKIDNKDLFIVFDGIFKSPSNLSAELSDKRAFMINPLLSGKTIKLPEVKPEINSEIHSYSINLENTDIKIRKESIYHGITGNEIRQIRFLSDEEKNKILQNSVSAVKIGAELTDFTLRSDLSDFREPAFLEKNIAVSDYGIKTGNYILFYIPELKYESSLVRASERKFSAKISASQSLTRSYNITVPENYSVSHIPDNVSLAFKNSKFTIDYSLNKDILSIEVKSIVNNMKFTNKEYAGFKSFIENRSLSDRLPVIFEEKID